MIKYSVVFVFLLSLTLCGFAQSPPKGQNYTHADTLRGSITKERAWWNVQHYAITIEPDFINKTTKGSNEITFQVVKKEYAPLMQIDLQQPLVIDSILFNNTTPVTFKNSGNVWLANLPKLQEGSIAKVNIFYHGTPHEALRAPWDGGWTFTTDTLGRPWMTVTCQGLGASIWYPCKDHQSDEPDNGATLTMVVPDTLVAVANGRLLLTENLPGARKSYKWAVINPINNYDIIPYIGKYVNFAENYRGEKGNLDVNYWVLDYNEAKARQYMPPEVHNMLHAFEHWFGPYPFYEDGYKLIDAPHTGMEHQSAVAYGNWYKPGYRLRDVSGTGWGMKWDFIIIHESGHEWFGNNITSKDLADMWIHEGFTNYSETLFVDYMYGAVAGNEYNAGTRRGIRNDKPIIPAYGVNAQGSGDMYPKSGNMLHSIRHGLDNDSLFRQILRGLNKTFYHQTVTATQVQQYINQHAGFNYNKVFQQYLTTTQIPVLELKFSADSSKLSYRYSNCVAAFNLPLVLKNSKNRVKLLPTTKWKAIAITANADLFTAEEIEKMYYLNVSVL